MQQRAQSLPYDFSALTVALLLIGAGAVTFPHAAAPALVLYLPSMYLVTTLVELATCVLLATLYARTHVPALPAITLMYLACGLLDIASLVTTEIPGYRGPLIFAGNNAAPYLFTAWHLVLAFGAIAYAADRRHDPLRTPTPTRQQYMLPSAMIATAIGVVVVVWASLTLPHVYAGSDLSHFRSSGFPYVDGLATVAALALLVRRIRMPDVNDLDYAVLLNVIASAMVIIIALAPIQRFGLAWTTARLISVFGSGFVLVAIVRYLIDGITATSRTEADAARAEASVYRQNADIEASLVKSRFVAMVSHELRTPLGGIIGMAELLGRTTLTERQRSFTSAIAASADTLLRIVNDLLDFSRVESGTLTLEDMPLNLAQTVEEVVVLFREQARLRGVALHVYIDPTLPTTITGDQTRLKQVLQNLLNNAVRFTSVGSIRVEVTRDFEPDGQDVVCFAVHDTGIGIGMQAQERVFQPFTQEDASTARRYGGTGLGLAIARHLVELMGGRISLRSVLGVGSTFTFTLPFRASAWRATSQPLLTGLRVLIVEPDDLTSALLTRYVDGWEMVRSAVAATADIFANDSGRWDVVIIGPGVSTDDALAAVPRIRDHPALARADVILLRDEVVGEDAESYASFDACLGGLLRQSALLDTISRLRRLGFVDPVAPPVDGIEARPPRHERVLVAEDNEVNQALLAAQLEHLGLHADIVSDGATAISTACEHAYDLIFMDCQMPGIDGFEAARRIRETANNASTDTPIIAVTANVLPGYREICLAAGMNDYLAKPALIEPLSAIVDRWLPRPQSGAPPPPGASSVPPAVAPVPPADLDATRSRLLEIFGGDTARVNALILRSITTLLGGAVELHTSLDARDPEPVARLAHKLKGIALELNLAAIAESLRDLESRAREADWEGAEAVFATCTTALAALELASDSATS